MRSFINAFGYQLRTDLTALKTDHPTIYKYTADMLDQIVFEKLKDPSKDYILTTHAGQVKYRFETIVYGLSITVRQFNTDTIPFYEFEFICKGIEDSVVKMGGKGIQDTGSGDTTVYHVVFARSMIGIRPQILADNSYFCSMTFEVKVDLTAIPDEDIELV